MADKWYLKDWQAPQRIVVGKLIEARPSEGFTNDGDTNLFIEPKVDPDNDNPNIYRMLLINRFDSVNSDGLLECEVNLGVKIDGQTVISWKEPHLAWVRSLVGGEVTAQGIWVDDDGHDSKTELHPMDVVFGSVTRSILNED